MQSIGSSECPPWNRSRFSIIFLGPATIFAEFGEGSAPPHGARRHRDLEALTSAMAGHKVVFHFASNPDIAQAARNPMIDFTPGVSPYAAHH